jgi:hypothetical protein
VADEWVPVGCARSDELLATGNLTVLAGRAVMHGPDAEMYREWGSAGGVPVLRDHSYPGTDRQCKHYERTITREGQADVPS